MDYISKYTLLLRQAKETSSIEVGVQSTRELNTLKSGVHRNLQNWFSAERVYFSTKTTKTGYGFIFTIQYNEGAFKDPTGKSIDLELAVEKLSADDNLKVSLAFRAITLEWELDDMNKCLKELGLGFFTNTNFEDCKEKAEKVYRKELKDFFMMKSKQI